MEKNSAENVWFIDINDMSMLTKMSRKFLEKEILCDPRMKLLERKKTQKRWWPKNETFKVINEITSEW